MYPRPESRQIESIQRCLPNSARCVGHQLHSVTIKTWVLNRKDLVKTTFSILKWNRMQETRQEQVDPDGPPKTVDSKEA